MSKIDNEALFQQILEHIKDGVYLVDVERRILYWNKGAEQITGFPAKKVTGSFCYDNILNHVTENGIQLCYGGCPLHATMQDGKPRQAEVFLHHAKGHRVPVLVRTNPVRDKSGSIIGAVETFSSNAPVLKLRRRMDRLERSALRDPLTGAGNRRYLEMRMQSALAELRGNGSQSGILFVDIDRFKDINDTYGHEVGDRVLLMVAQTLKQNVRLNDALARWGGDEFILLLFNINQKELLRTAEKLRILIEQSRLRLEDQEIGVTVSIGATMIRPQDVTDLAIQRADLNMYSSKQAGRNRVTLDAVGRKKRKREEWRGNAP